jgi:hypothetical protein
MPAATVNQLFAYEHAIESCWETILSTVDADLTPYIEATDRNKRVPYVDIQLRKTNPEGSQFVNQNIVYYKLWNAILMFRVVTARGKTSDRQSEFIGMVRIAAQSFKTLATQAILPFHAVLNMQDAGVERGVIKDERLDWAEVYFKIKFGIRSDAWPV